MRLRIPIWILLLAVFVSGEFPLSTFESLAAADPESVQTGGIAYFPLVIGSQSVFGGELDNGGVLDGPDGIRIGAPQGSLAAPVDIIFSSPAPPTQTLPSPALAAGPFVEIAADQEISLAPENPLILAFPVPDGADTAHLALGVLVSGEFIEDVYTPEKEWIFLNGLYDASGGLFLAAETGLIADGEIYVLVEHADFDSPPPAAGGLDQTTSDFFVSCTNFSSPDDCTTATEDQAETYLKEFEVKLQGELGFAAPRLLGRYSSLSIDPLGVVYSGGYQAFLEPATSGFCKDGKAAGYYSAEKARLVLCVAPGSGAINVQVLLHEYFHATEYGYPAALLDKLSGARRKFIIEGMAKAVEESFFTSGNVLARSKASGWEKLHYVDISLDSEYKLDPYNAQDFWVYYGQQFGQKLTYFKNILSRGAKTSDVADALGSGDYLESYWPWAKNQAIEAYNTLNGALTTPCELEAGAVFTIPYFNFKYNNADTRKYDTTVPALTTVVIKVVFDYDYDFAAGVVFPTTYDPSGQADMALEYKFYKDGESDCDQIPDGYRTYEQVKTSDAYYVLIANKEINRDWDYTVSFEVDPIPGP